YAVACIFREVRCVSRSKRCIETAVLSKRGLHLKKSQRLALTNPTTLERLRELRNIYDPFDRIVLNEFEVEHYRNVKGVKLNEDKYYRKLGKIIEKLYGKA
ncbi:MAG: hypothetical protein ABII64_02395, partial [Elusimicrobiota bacterium]